MAAQAEQGWQSHAGARQRPVNLGAALNASPKSGGFIKLIPSAGSSCLAAGSSDAGREPCLGQAGRTKATSAQPLGGLGRTRPQWMGGRQLPARQIAGPALATPTGFVD